MASADFEPEYLICGFLADSHFLAAQPTNSTIRIVKTVSNSAIKLSQLEKKKKVYSVNEVYSSMNKWKKKKKALKNYLPPQNEPL